MRLSIAHTILILNIVRVSSQQPMKKRVPYKMQLQYEFCHFGIPKCYTRVTLKVRATETSNDRI